MSVTDIAKGRPGPSGNGVFFGVMIWLSLAAAHAACAAETEAAFVTSEGTPFVAKAHYPGFSWATTPMYYHFGDIDRVLAPDEVEFIAARTGFIGIEKSHGYREFGDTVLGTKHEAAAFHGSKPTAKVLFYFNSFVVWPFTRFNQNFTADGLVAHPELKKFLMVDRETGRLAEKTDGAAPAYYFDVLNPEFRQWWVAAVLAGVAASGCDGAFIDRMNVGSHSGHPKEKAAEVERAKGAMMAELRKGLGPDKLLLGNNAADNPDVFPSCDAFMFEHYNASVTSKENLLKEWGDMLQVARAGKISVYRFGARRKGAKLMFDESESASPGMAKLSQRQLEYFLACYLIGAQPYSYFQYNWGWNLADGNLVDYPELRKPLGAPKGAYVRVAPDGWQFTREFEHASVWLDTDKREAQIRWH